MANDKKTRDSSAESPEEMRVRFTASPEMLKYLPWLSENTLLGKDENEVARQVLTMRLSEMRQENFRDRTKAAD
jgi:hypothetical protein